MQKQILAADKQRIRALLAEFQEAAAGNLDEDEKLLMNRVAKSVEAPEIFGKIGDDVTIRRLLSLCLEVHSLAKNFNKSTGEAHRLLSRAPAYERAIADIDELLKRTQTPALERLQAYTLPDPDRIELERRALASIRDRLAVGVRTATETVRRLGATRKSHGRKAAETAAIGWMAEGVKRITGRTNSRLTADLAQLVLGCTVSLDRVDNAAETRKREWRARF
jgi:hypothetical protein